MAPQPPTTLVFTIDGPIARSDLPGLCSRIRSELEGTGAEVALCDVHTIPAVDAVTVDALARLQLLARRLGCQVRLRNASDELLELVAFMGLANVLAESRSGDERSLRN